MRGGGASAKTASRMRLPSHSHHAQTNSSAACLRVNGPRSTSGYCGPVSVFLPRAILQQPFSHAPRRSGSSSAGEGHGAQPTPRRAPTKRTRRRYAYYLFLAVLVSGGLVVYGDKGRRDRGLLNPERFTAGHVVSNEPVSPTAFILTVETPSGSPAGSAAAAAPTNHTVVRDAWRHGLWSVEIKQPQLQIARNYTPLPPPPGETDQAPPGAVESRGAARLRFLVRRYDGGEVSTYLSRLRPGDAVELRGPHLGFDVGARLGPAGRRVVFLAGGTGVAPALQAAAFLLDARGVSVQILWANRAPADCAGCVRAARPGWLRRARGAVDAQREEPGPMVRQLRELQGAYESRGRTLEVRCLVDEEGGAFQGRDIARAVGPRPEASGPTSTACYFHSQSQLVHSTEGDSHERRCDCVVTKATGRNLFMISGPDGFVSAYAGPKVWTDGAERQGPVGGMLAELMRKDPAAWNDWLVLKQ